MPRKLLNRKKRARPSLLKEQRLAARTKQPLNRLRDVPNTVQLNPQRLVARTKQPLSPLRDVPNTAQPRKNLVPMAKVK